MIGQMLGFFVSGFTHPTAWGIGLAIIFGAIWLAAYWPQPLFKRHPWRWAVLIFFGVLVGSAILSWIAIAVIQMPLQLWSNQVLTHFWSGEILTRWILLVGIPIVLLSGLVQEGSKLIPAVVYWWRKGKSIDPKLGLAIGAIAGAGFGIFEARWIHDNFIFATGWSWEAVQTSGVVALAGFWERFFVVGFHTAASALAGYGLARGWGWQFYLIAAFLHALINYSALFLQSGVMTIVRAEVFIASFALLVTYGALWLRWRKPAIVAEVETEEAEGGSEV